MKWARTLAVVLALWALGSLVWLFAHRVGYPYDLEWMEGGMLTHALRLMHGQPIYAAPSVDFIPYLYTPLYPRLLAFLGRHFGLGYTLARLVSVISFGAALVCGYVFARREGGSRAAALAAMAIPAAAFVPCGTFYDLARPDSLFLGLVVVALLVGWWARRSHLGVAVAALLFVAAFFAKQTASPFMVALGVALLVASPWRAITYALTLAAAGLPLLWHLNHTTDGWFWTYVFRLHQRHSFFAARAFLGTPGRLFLLLFPGLLLVPWALSRRRTPGLTYAAWLALVGVLDACIGFGTQWAYINAFIPGVFFVSMAMGVSAGLLADESARERPPRLRPQMVYSLLAATLLVAPGGLTRAASHVVPESWALRTDTAMGYDPRPYVPTAADRQAGDALIARLRATAGEVLIPFHPFYAYLAGKRTYLHRMGVLDIWRAGMGAPRGLAEAIRAHRFALVVMDTKIDGNWFMWPGLLSSYHVADEIRGPKVVSGSPTEPRYLLLPTSPKRIGS